MKKRFSCLLIVGILLIASCQKEPPKGNYTGKFEGSYMADYQMIVYSSDYVFEITKSTKSEIHLKEQDSQTTSKLQKTANDSIVGKIGFGRIYNPSQGGGPAINTIDIRGKYYKENQKSYISGIFSTIIVFNGEQYSSEGTFVLRSY